MTVVDYSRTKSSQAAVPRRPAKSRMSVSRNRMHIRSQRLHVVYAYCLTGIVLLAPLPLASNRPVLWMFWAAVLFLLAAVYLGVHLARRTRPPVALRAMALPAVLSGSFVAYVTLQGVAPFADGPASASPGATLMAALRWSSYAVFFYLLVQVAAHKRTARKMGWAIFAGGALYAVLALTLFRFANNDLLLIASRDVYADDVTGPFINRNAFATFLGMIAVLGLSLIQRRRPRLSGVHDAFAWAASEHSLRFVVSAALLAFVFLALIGTGSRMGLIATLCGCALVLFLARRSDAPAHRSRLQIATVPFFVLVGAMVLVSSAGGAGSIEQFDRFLFVASDGVDRLALYRQTMELIASQPLWGHGFDAYEIAFQTVRKPPVDPDLSWDHAHSLYLELWAEAGLIAGSLPFLICAVLLVRVMRSLNSGAGSRSLAIAATSAGLVAGLHSTVDFSLEIEANVFLFLAILSLGFSGLLDNQDS